MRTRQEIKEYAKGAFEAQRGTCVLGLFLVMLITVGFALVSNIPSVMLNFSYTAMDFNVALLGTVAVIGIIISILAVPVIIISVVLEVNVSGFFVKVYYGQTVKYSEPYSEIKNNFGRKLGGMFWQMLWIYLWSLAFMTPAIIISVIVIVTAVTSFYHTVQLYVVFVPLIAILLACVPIVIKTLSYSMTQYILASNPNVPATNAIKLSMRMTKGHKGKIFVMWMSFIGWQLLNALTMGILGIFYVNPYMYASLAGLFVELRSLAVASGVIHPSELDGVLPQHQQYHQYPPVQQYSPDPYHQQQPPPPQAYPYAPDPYNQQPPPPQAYPYAPDSYNNQPPPPPQAYPYAPDSYNQPPPLHPYVHDPYSQPPSFEPPPPQEPHPPQEQPDDEENI